MPLSVKARIEVYLPDLAETAYQELLNTLQSEFTYTFGGCTLVRGLAGSYLSGRGLIIQDPINLIFTDTFLDFTDQFSQVAQYADHIRTATFEALDEEAVLVVSYPVYHSE